MNTVESIVVIADDPGDLGGLCAAASRLATAVSALAIGTEEDIEKSASCGANTVYRLHGDDQTLFEDHFETIKKLVLETQPDVVMMKATKRMRLLAGRLAVALDTGVMTDLCSVRVENGALLGEHLVFGGGALRTESSLEAPCIALVGEGVCSVQLENASPAPIVALDFEPGRTRAKLIERRARAAESTNLAAAKRVVSVGRGLESQADLALIEELARSLEAEVGCTRPIAEGENWMDRSRYLGVSGVTVNPDLFVAVGVSGQVQHMVGAASAKTIFAINKDKNAPIFKQADYGIVANLYEVVAKLTEALDAKTRADAR